MKNIKHLYCRSCFIFVVFGQKVPQMIIVKDDESNKDAFSLRKY